MRARSLWGLLAAAAAVVAGFVLLSIVGLLFGLGGGDHEDSAPDRPARTAAAPAAPAPPAAPSSTVVREPAARGVAASFSTQRDPLEPRPVLDDLRDGEARVLAVRHLLPNEVGVAAQCQIATRECDAGIPILTNEDGTALFLFEFTRCVGCALVVRTSEVRFGADLVFGTSAPPIATVRAGRADATGAAKVDASGFPPGARGVVTQCAPPGPADPIGCGAPAPEVQVTFDEGGHASLRYPVHAGRTGTGSCSRGSACAITVLVPGQVVRVEATQLLFAGGPSADYTGWRVLAGLLVALLLLAFGALVIRRTDWTPVGMIDEMPG